MPARSAHRKHIKSANKTHQRQPFDFVVYFFMVATPLFELPQLIQIYAHRNAHNVSLLTWSFFCIDNLVWIVYGARKKEWPVLLTSVIYEIIEVSIVIGILLYS